MILYTDNDILRCIWEISSGTRSAQPQPLSVYIVQNVKN